MYIVTKLLKKKKIAEKVFSILPFIDFICNLKITIKKTNRYFLV